jgi:peptidoglycan/xylan/chitin deacetylase (PgdA/CDA1 family)
MNVREVNRLPGMPSIRTKMRLGILYFASYICWFLGITKFLSFVMRRKAIILVLNYHRVTPKSRPEISGYSGNITSMGRFVRQISYLKRKYYFIGPGDISNFLSCSRTVSQTYVLLTFDDGYRETYEYAAQILRQNSIAALIFVTNDCLTGDFVLPADRYAMVHQANGGKGEFASRLYLNLQETRWLIDWGFEIGSHTLSHPELGGIPLSEQEKEIKLSKQKLEKTLETNIRYFSYPIGAISAETSKLVKEAGYQAGFGNKLGGVASGSDPFCLPRVSAANYPVPVIAFKINVIQLWDAVSRMVGSNNGR